MPKIRKELIKLIDSKMKLVKRETSCDMSEVNIFPNGYVSKISGENHIMEGIINLVLQSEKIPKDFKDKIIIDIGSAWFQKFPDDTYIWRGL